MKDLMKTKEKPMYKFGKVKKEKTGVRGFKCQKC